MEQLLSAPEPTPGNDPFFFQEGPVNFLDDEGDNVKNAYDDNANNEGEGDKGDNANDEGENANDEDPPKFSDDNAKDEGSENNDKANVVNNSLYYFSNF